jgi:hypothetical protein
LRRMVSYCVSQDGRPPGRRHLAGSRWEQQHMICRRSRADPGKFLLAIARAPILGIYGGGGLVYERRVTNCEAFLYITMLRLGIRSLAHSNSF